jgi:hypothetical protein
MPVNPLALYLAISISLDTETLDSETIWTSYYGQTNLLKVAASAKRFFNVNNISIILQPGFEPFDKIVRVNLLKLETCAVQQMWNTLKWTDHVGFTNS